MERGLLEGVRVADFTWAWAGAYATEILAFLGAEVIKIESRKRPDQSRMRSLTTGQRFSGLDQSPVFNDLNLNKLSITINLSQPEGIELAKKLIKVSDIVAQNMRPGVMAKMGLGWESARKINPSIIYLSSSARGASGPEGGYSGYAPNFAALAGMSYLTGYPDDKPSYMVGEIDLLSAMTSAFALLTALNYRARTGEGQYIDLSSSEAIAVTAGEVLLDCSMNGSLPTRRGNYDSTVAPHNCYRCKGEDKWVSIVVSTPKEWKSFCKALGNPPWTKERRFFDAASRRENQEELDRLIEEWTVQHTHYEVMEKLQKAGVAAVPSFNSEELCKDPHLKGRNFWMKVSHPIVGEQLIASPPWKLSNYTNHTRRGSLIGEYNHYVFGELLGISEKEIRRLEEEEVIY